MSRTGELVAELTAEHDAFHDALEAVDVELVTAPGVVGDWSVRDLVVHVAFWAEHAVQALRLASDARGAEFDYDGALVNDMNARLLEEARRTPAEAAIEREERAFEVLAGAVADLDESLLELRLGNGDTVAEVIGYDGAEHYREHAAHLRAWFGDEEDEAADEAERP